MLTVKDCKLCGKPLPESLGTRRQYHVECGKIVRKEQQKAGYRRWKAKGNRTPRGRRRKCLRCKELFYSKHIGNRLCIACNLYADRTTSSFDNDPHGED